MNDLEALEKHLAGSQKPGVLIGGIFWFFKSSISLGGIEARRARAAARKMIRIFSLISATILLLIFIALFYIDLNSVKTIGELFALRPTLIPFYLSLFVFGFAWFLSKEKAMLIQRIPQRDDDVTVEVSNANSAESLEKTRDISKVLSDESQEAIDHAFEYAYKAGHKDVHAVHLFLGTMPSMSVRMLFMRLGISFEKMKDPIRRHISDFNKGETVFSASAQKIIAQAFANAVNRGQKEIPAIEIFIESYKADDFLKELFYSLGVEEDEFMSVVDWMRINEQLKEQYLRYREAASFKPTGSMNRSYTAIATPLLDRLSEDYTALAVKGALPLLVGRDREMNELLRVVESGKNVLLVGPPGVGKGAMIAGIAERMVEEHVPDLLQDKRLVKISIPHIISSNKSEELLLNVLQEVGMSGNIVLILENIEQLIASDADLASVLVHELEKRYTYVLATTTPQGAKLIEKSSLPTVFSSLMVEEPNRKDTLRVLQSSIGGIENKNRVVFTFEGLAAIVDFATRYMHDSFLPAKALQLAEEVGLASKSGDKNWKHISKEDVAGIVSQKANVPLTELSQDEKTTLLNLEDRMHERIIGQEHAVEAVAAALRRARTELRSQNRPIANFLFLGPTGVGKTELAKTTAEVYFGKEDAMIRFDMSEFQDKNSIERLIGGPNQNGQLTDAVRKQPFALLLLDELEKAHPDILNLFLQVMDDGRLTDGTGRTIDFTNIILIATSNAGTQYIQDEVSKGTNIDAIKQSLVEHQLKEVYRPEFLNRFDGVMVFKPLAMEDVVAIAYLMIQKVVGRIEEKGIHFRATDEAIHELAEKGYDPKFGARPLRRVIQETVDNAIADILLKGEASRRDTLILQAGGEIVVEKASKL